MRISCAFIYDLVREGSFHHYVTPPLLLVQSAFKRRRKRNTPTLTGEGRLNLVARVDFHHITAFNLLQNCQKPHPWTLAWCVTESSSTAPMTFDEQSISTELAIYCEVDPSPNSQSWNSSFDLSTSAQTAI